jgi:hypothetical protein
MLPASDGGPRIRDKVGAEQLEQIPMRWASTSCRAPAGPLGPTLLGDVAGDRHPAGHRAV